jgi:hypothetical protein
MAIQFSVGLRNTMIGNIETTIGTAAKLYLWTGSAPANCAAAESGTGLAVLTLPVDWLTSASTGTVSKNGTWNGTATAAGVAAHYRLYDNGTATCYEQGTIGQGSGDLSLDNTTIASGQTITVTQWDRVQGGA